MHCVCKPFHTLDPFYLVYFVDDATVLVVNITKIHVVECMDEMVKPGGNCHVKEKRNYEGQVITYGEQ